MSKLAESKECPNCGETIKAKAIICRYCQRGLSDTHFRQCTFCGEMIRKEASLCRYCKSFINETTGRSSRPSDPGQDVPKNPSISPEDWKRVPKGTLRTGEPMDVILARLGLASQDHIKNALELQYGVNYVSLAEVKTQQGCLSLIPEAGMREHQIVAIAKDGNRVTVAMVNPKNLKALGYLKLRLKGTVINPTVCTSDEFAWFMENRYGKNVTKDL